MNSGSCLWVVEFVADSLPSQHNHAQPIGLAFQVGTNFVMAVK